MRDLSQCIPVYVGSCIVDFCDPHDLERYKRAANAELEFITKKKTGKVVQINLKPLADESAMKSHGDPRPTYEEHLGNHTVTMLKRVNRKTGSLVRWHPDAKFNPKRFNPDSLQSSAVRALSK